MPRFWKYVFLIFVGLPFASKAQQKTALHFDWKLNNVAKLETRNSFITFNTFPPKPAQLNTYPDFKYTLPKTTAVFCKLEDALHKRFNLWIKVRMGTDDRYSN